METKEIIKKESGIYCIVNMVNDNMYVGLSVNVYRRLQAHRSKLINGSHRNTYLQNSWNKYGEDSFEFKVLEYCDEKILDDREVYYIEKFNTIRPNGYNLTTGGSVGFRASESTSLLKAMNSKERIIQFDCNMNPLCYHLNINRANKLYTNSSSGLSGISQCIRGNISSIYGYKWMTFSQCKDKGIDISDIVDVEGDVDKYPRMFHQRGGVVRISFDMKEVVHFKTLKDAHLSIGKGANKGNIKLACDNAYGRKSAYGYYWMYRDSYDETGIDESKFKKIKFVKQVARCDKDTDEIVEIYNSARDAGKDGFNYKNISQVCNGERKTHKGYRWKFILN